MNKAKSKPADIEEEPVGRPLEYSSPSEMQADIDAYFARCDEEKEPYLISGLLLALKINSRTTLCKYEKREEFTDTVKKAKLKVEHRVWVGVTTGKINIVGGLFNLKTNFGYVETQKIEHSGSVVTEIEIHVVDPK